MDTCGGETQWHLASSEMATEEQAVTIITQIQKGVHLNIRIWYVCRHARRKGVCVQWSDTEIKDSNHEGQIILFAIS